MPNRSWITAFAQLWLGCCCLAAPTATPRFSVARFGAKEGLPQKSVLTMTQTRDGYLWVGTLAGLARFDGRRFTSFDPNNTSGLKSGRISKLFEDHQGNLWIGTENEGILLMDKEGKISPVVLPSTSSPPRLIAACEDAGGSVWLHTAGTGADGLAGFLARYRQGRIESWPWSPSAGRSLISEDSGLIWVGTDWEQRALNPMATNVAPGAPPAQEGFFVNGLDCLLASAKGGYWRLASGTNNGRILKCRGTTVERDLGPYPWDQSRARVFAACEDLEGNLIVGTLGDGVYWFDAAGKPAHISRDQGLLYPRVLSLCVDREGCLWVGTHQDGLNRVRRQYFDALKESEGSTVQSVCEDGQQGIWVGYFAPRVDHARGDAVEQCSNVFQFAPPSEIEYSKLVRCVFVDRTRQLWVGTYHHGLFQLREDVFLPAPGSTNLLNPHILAIHEDRQGMLWVGTEGGLARWDGENWRTYSTLNGLSGNAVQAIADDAQGNLWLGTDGGGINRFRDGRFTSYAKTNGLPSDTIASLWADADGVLWAGTSGGLARFGRGKWTSFTTRDGLITSNIGYLVEDAQGYLWLGSNAGLMRIRKQALNDLAAQPTNSTSGSITVRAYDEADGLPSGECSSGSQPAACRSSDGRIWFPTIQGLASVDPALLRPNTNQIPVVIESVLVAGAPVITNRPRASPLQEVVLQPGKQGLEIRFTSLNLAGADRARFKYRLIGHDAEWSPANDSRVAYYGKLLPHEYTFQVSACNEDGVWNQTGCSLAVTVLPPFWSTAWFQTLSGLCLFGLVAGSIYYVSTQKLHRELALMRQHEALEAERARIARDLHDQLGANLTQVTLLGEMAETDKDLPTEVEGHARQITQTARETTRALDEIVWTVNPANDTLDGLVNYLCKYAQEYVALAGLRYRLEVPDQLPGTPIPPELRHNVFLVAKEAINNVVKHAQASSVWLRLQIEPERFTLEIQDDGRGLSAEAERKGRNGLRNMRQRMEEVGGAFTIGPGPTTGTTVRLSVPLGKG